jgi:hypothetical protein
MAFLQIIINKLYGLLNATFGLLIQDMYAHKYRLVRPDTSTANKVHGHYCPQNGKHYLNMMAIK